MHLTIILLMLDIPYQKIHQKLSVCQSSQFRTFQNESYKFMSPKGNEQKADKKLILQLNNNKALSLAYLSLL